MHERNIAQPRMLICCVIKISDHMKCWSGESPHCWAAVSRAPEFGSEFHDVMTMQERGPTSDRWRRRQVLHDVTSSVVCHSLFVASRNSDLNSGALETAEQSKGMQRYHEFSPKSALKLLILGWVVVYDSQAGENQLVRSSDSDQTLVRFSYWLDFARDLRFELFSVSRFPTYTTELFTVTLLIFSQN
jgi:hypothetical protein